MGKRKRYHENRRSAPTHVDRPSDEPERKRRRSNEAHEDEIMAAPREASLGQAVPQSRGESGWTTVKHKSGGRRDALRDSRSAKQISRSNDVDDYPRLRFHTAYRDDIRIHNLKDLALYTLTDAVAPKWIGVKNARGIKKVVAVMVSGLDEAHLQQKQSEESSDQRSLAWLHENIMSVKAPGDAARSRVHSPLQAMLLSHDQDSKKDSRTGPSYLDTSRIPITELVHTAEELRDAEFPIHPAILTVKEEAELEAERRAKTGQSTTSGWVDTRVQICKPDGPSKPVDYTSQDLKVYSLDCEMVQTSDDAFTLARISLISYPDGNVLIDEYVKPRLPITNYFTQYSGITPAILENVTTTLEDIQQRLLEVLDSSTILLGHSLDSDLNALKLAHPFVIDTSIIYPHPRGLPLRSSLKFLANKYLRREIQTGGATGHDSVEDAKAVLDLVKLKCEKGHKWGTMEANGEPIFRRLRRAGKTSAMVEYGMQERGLGRDATHAIACQNDNEVVAGIQRAIHGDSFFDFEIPSGGVDFVWGRLRALEYARGWVSGSPRNGAGDKDGENKVARSGKLDDSNGESKDAPSNPSLSRSETISEDDRLNTLANTTIQHLDTIYNALPPRTLFIVFNGTSDVRPVMRLQAQQAQYRKEFKVKKWDELSVKWTDVEEQALRRACEAARSGWGCCVVK